VRNKQLLQSSQRVWRNVYLTLLWISVTWSVVAAALVAQFGSGENGKLLSAALALFGALGIAFAKATKSIEEPRRWHWIVGAFLILPGLSIAAG
jgi:membrane protease YdiL (CAAX protease family)